MLGQLLRALSLQLFNLKKDRFIRGDVFVWCGSGLEYLFDFVIFERILLSPKAALQNKTEKVK